MPSIHATESVFPVISFFLFGIISSASCADQPNIMLILADDCTFRDIGCYGGQALTPNIDKLATEGMKFERCFQAAPMCSPTRHNLFTGIYPVKSGAYPNHTMLYPDVKSVAHHMKELGYRVAHTGKLHVNPWKNFPWESLGGWDELKLERVDKFLNEQAKSETPFCFFACSTSPHGPWDKGNPDDYPVNKIVLPPYIIDTPRVRKDFGKYLAEIGHFDWQVGEIVDMLETYNLAESTIVIVLSEQGASFPFGKWTCYDTGLQSAMVIRWPEGVDEGSVSNAMVEYVDITPTLIDIAGGKPVDGLDGESFLPVLQQRTDQHKTHVFGIMTTNGILNGSDAYAIRSIRDEQYKLILNLNHESKYTNISMKSGYYASMQKKADAGDQRAEELLHAYEYRPQIELFDMLNDPFELNNLAEDPAYSKIVLDLKTRLEDWMTSQGDLGIPTEKSAKLRQIKNVKNNQRLSKEEILKQFPN